MDRAPLDPDSEVWHHHTNTFEKDTVAAGIRKHYTEPETLNIDDYLLYSALCQGTMLGYALELMRSRADCDGSLFWMFNDCWGEVGWTIVDYYLRRKPSWYFVRRAFAPIRMILRPAGDEINLVIANDTQIAESLVLEVGYLSLDGSFDDYETIQVNVFPLARTQVFNFKRENHDPRRGLWFARTTGESILLPAIFRSVDYRKLQVSTPGFETNLVKLKEQVYTFKISTDSYAHAVYLDLPEGAVPSDNYFDLLPGESRDIQVISPEPLRSDAMRVSCVNG